jgi:O-phosphoseryl-tRNA(Cys) synthetase
VVDGLADGLASGVGLGDGAADIVAAGVEDASMAASTEVEVRAPVMSTASTSRNKPTAEKVMRRRRRAC